MNLKKHIWEGWTVQHFINDLEPILEMIQSNRSHIKPISDKAKLKEWCIDNQPGYKKYIPDVVKYFCIKYNIK